MKSISTFTLLASVLLMVANLQTATAQEQTALADGASLWANNCMRCHNPRPLMERNDREWKTVADHMRVRANLTRTEARLITFFLQTMNIPESGVNWVWIPNLFVYPMVRQIQCPARHPQLGQERN